MPARLREVRIKHQTSLTTSFTAPDDSYWNNDTDTFAANEAKKFAITSFDATGLKQTAIESNVLQTQKFNNPAPYVGPAQGNVKIGFNFAPAENSTTPTPIMVLLSKVFGNIASPGVVSDLCDSSGTHTSTNIYASGIEGNISAGQCVMVGTRGDGRGDGQARRVYATGTDYIQLDHPLPAAPNDGDAIYLAHTVYPDPDAAQQYLDWLAIGNNSYDQLQGIGCMGPCTINGLGIGEMPGFELDLMCSDWRWVAANPETMDKTTAASGVASPPTEHEGLCLIYNYGTATYNAAQKMPIGEMEIDPGITFEQKPGLNGNNGIEGFVRTMCKPTLSGTILFSNAMGRSNGTYDILNDDYQNSTEKSIILQFGHTQFGTLVFTIPRAFITETPVHATINNLQGVKVNFAGSIYGPDSTPANDLLQAPIAIHFI